MANLDVRMAAKRAGIPLWRVAQMLQISEASMTRMLRLELSPEDKARILRAIENAAHGDRAEQLILK